MKDILSSHPIMTNIADKHGEDDFTMFQHFAPSVCPLTPTAAWTSGPEVKVIVSY